jgi:hypothetical protein
MADEVDLAQDQIEASLRTALQRAPRRAQLGATGFCHNCRAPVPAGGLWCDALCREDYDREQAARDRNGRARR